MIRAAAILAGGLVLAAAVYFAVVQNLFARLAGGQAAVSGPDCEYHPLAAEDGLIPRPEDWTDYGPVLEAGAEGDWDFNWADETPGGILKKDGQYYFYFVAADGYRSFDGGPRHRAIGVATSRDGIHYTKHAGNPILAHAPNQGEEEGANSAALSLDEDGQFIMFYGAAFGPRDIINANGRLAVSADGYTFSDRGLVLNRLNPFLYGFGDEIFPVAAYRYQGRWNLYYLPNGGINERTLGLARGSHPNWLWQTHGVLDERSGGKPVNTWGNINWLSEERIVLFIQRLWWPDTYLEVRTAHPGQPQRLSVPVACYFIPGLKRGTAFLDLERRTWFMLYTDFSRFWKLKLAPAGPIDDSPPSTPAQVSATALDDETIQLTWQAAEDADTGVAAYRVYRDGERIAQTLDLSFSDGGLAELSRYRYTVSAVNLHGVEGQPAAVEAATPADREGPTLISAATGGQKDQLVVQFNERLDPASAADSTHYRIQPELQITSAEVQADGRSVRLTTSAHEDWGSYRLTVEGVLDAAREPNPIAAGSRVDYRHVPVGGLAGYWDLDEISGGLALDQSGQGGNGQVSGAVPAGGRRGAGLAFDGLDDFVQIESRGALADLTGGSFTFTAWFRPEDQPGGENPYAIVLRAGSHPLYTFGLAYNQRGQVEARLIGSDETFYRLASASLPAGEWHHAAMVVDRSAGQLHLYVDGAAAAGSPLAIPADLLDLAEEAGQRHTSGEYYIGSTKPDRGAGSFFAQHFKGIIDEVMIFSQALEADEIACLAGGCP